MRSTGRDLETSLKLLTKENDKLKSQNGRLFEKLRQVKNDFKGKEEECEQLARNYDLSRDELRRLQQKVEEERNEMRDIRRHFSKVCNQTNLSETLLPLLSKMTTYKTATSHLQAELDANHDKLEKYREEISVLRIAAEMNASQLVGGRNDFGSSRSIETDIIHNKGLARRNLVLQLSLKEREVRDLCLALSDAQVINDNLSDRMSEESKRWQRDLRAEREKVGRLEAEVQGLQEQVSSFQNSVQTMEASLSAFKEEREGLQEAMADMEEEHREQGKLWAQKSLEQEGRLEEYRQKEEAFEAAMLNMHAQITALQEEKEARKRHRKNQSKMKRMEREIQGKAASLVLEEKEADRDTL